MLATCLTYTRRKGQLASPQCDSRPHSLSLLGLGRRSPSPQDPFSVWFSVGPILVLGHPVEQQTLGPEHIYVSAGDQEVHPPPVDPYNPAERLGQEGKACSSPLIPAEGLLDFGRLK